MKTSLSFLLAMILGVAGIHAAEKPKVEAMVAKDKDSKPASTFPADIPKIYAFFRTQGMKKGDKVRAAWMAVDVGSQAPKGTKIDEATLALEADDGGGSFSLSKPTNGWPAGDYKVDLYNGDEMATSVKFSIEAAAAEAKPEKLAVENEKVKAEPDGAAGAQLTFKVHNTTKDKIVKLLASEDDKTYGNFDIGAGIAAGKEMTLAWGKNTNDSGCDWYFKAVFEDGTESPAVKFDFCEEDLELEF
ncbi:MAG: hypothetical protein ABI992_05645 [Chthoniobacterales bacterium]